MLLVFLLGLLRASADCQLRLILNDLGGDGWGTNYITATSNGSPVTFTSLTSAASVTNGQASLASGKIGSFSFTVPSGGSLDVSFTGTADSHCQQESWIVELFDIYNPFGAVRVLTSKFALQSGVVTPFSTHVDSVVCGPTPDAVSNVAVTTAGVVSTITWSRASSDTNSGAVAFVLFYTTDANPNASYLGTTFDTTFDCVLPIGTVHLSVQSLNQYGPGPQVTQDVTTKTYSFSRCFLRLFSSYGTGWGGGNPNDGSVTVKLSGHAFYTAGFGCTDGHGCHSTDHNLDIPAGQDWDLTLDFNEPSDGVEDCSFKLYRQDGVVLFDSDQDKKGPKTRNGKLPVHFDDGCPCADPWGDCVPNSGQCGAGKQSRNNYVSTGSTTCKAVPESQDCYLHCPVNCVGAFGDYSSCSPACGVGYQSRTYSITQKAEKNGQDCPFADGEVETIQCPNNPPCPQQCSYELTGYDTEGDGWHGGNIVVTGASSDVKLALVPTTDDSFDASKGSVNFQAVRGSTVTFTWTAGSDVNADHEASFDVKLLVAGVPCKGLPDVLENPAGLDTTLAPTPVTSFVATCADCSTAPKALCDSLNRHQCEFSQLTDNTCGACLAGYTADSVASGNTACQDIDECNSGLNPCDAQNAKCKNTPGSYFCYCSDITKPCQDEKKCDVPPVAPGFLETGVLAKTTPTTNPSTVTCAGILTRKDWGDLTQTEKQAWVNAIRAAFAYNLTETINNGTVLPYNWNGWGLNTGSKSTGKVINQSMSLWQWARTEHLFSSDNPGQQVHNGNIWFLPWHRNFLKNMETSLQKASGSCVTIPYWDSSANRLVGTTWDSKTNAYDIGGVDANSLALLSDTAGTGLCMMSGSGTYNLTTDNNCPLKGIPGCGPWEKSNPYCGTGYNNLWRALSWGNWVDTSDASGVPGIRSPTEYYQLLTQYATDYADFCKNLETFHGGVHLAVGGWMGSLESAAGDPLFIMHHAFVDMLWAGQQSCVTSTDSNQVWPTSYPAGQSFTTPMPRANNYAPSDMYDPTKIGTRYDFNFFNKLHADTSDAGASTYCTGNGANSNWWDTSSMAAGSSVLPTTSANWYNVTLNGHSWLVYDWGNGTVWVQTSSGYNVYGPSGWTYQRWLMNPNAAPTSYQLLQQGSKILPKLRFAIKASQDGSQAIAAAPAAPYAPYKGFYTPLPKGVDPTERYCTHGASKKHKAGKGKGKKTADKPTQTQDDNLAKLRQAYNDDFNTNKDHKSALEAVFRVECTFDQHNKQRLYTADQIKKFHLQKAAAEGKCDDTCYKLTKGKNAKKHSKKYLAKHKGKFPKGYVEGVQQTEGVTPPALLEALSENQKTNVHPRKHHEGFALNPASHT